MLSASRGSPAGNGLHQRAAACGPSSIRSLVRLLVQRSAPRKLLQRPAPSAQVVSAAATGDGSSEPSAARPQRRNGRTAEEHTALTDPRVLASLRPDPAGEVTLLRAEVAALQAAGRELEGRVREAVEAAAAARTQAAGSREELTVVKAQLATLTARVEGLEVHESAAVGAHKQVSPSPGLDLARQKTTILAAAAERVDLCARTATTREEKLLLDAAEEGNLREVKRLLSNPAANPNVQDKNDDTALHLASANGNPEVVEALLRAGADMEAKDVDGATPLHIASSGGCTEVVEALLRAGADKEVRFKFGHTPLDLAKLCGQAEVVALLEGWRSK